MNNFLDYFYSSFSLLSKGLYLMSTINPVAVLKVVIQKITCGGENIILLSY